MSAGTPPPGVTPLTVTDVLRHGTAPVSVYAQLSQMMKAFGADSNAPSDGLKSSLVPLWNAFATVAVFNAVLIAPYRTPGNPAMLLPWVNQMNGEPAACTGAQA